MSKAIDEAKDAIRSAFLPPTVKGVVMRLLDQMAVVERKHEEQQELAGRFEKWAKWMEERVLELEKKG